MAVETIYTAIQTFIYTLLLYSMIGFEWKAGKFLWFFYYMTMCFVYFTMYGMMVVALTPGHQIAAIVMAFFLSFWNLFSGFLLPRMVSLSHMTYIIIIYTYLDHLQMQMNNVILNLTVQNSNIVKNSFPTKI